MAHSWLRALDRCARAAQAGSLGTEKPGFSPRLSGVPGPRAPARALALAAAAASTYPRSPGREWERRLHARGGGAHSTMVPGAAAAGPCPLARRALSSSCKLSGSAVDKKSVRPSASLACAGWGEPKGMGRARGRRARRTPSARGGREDAAQGIPARIPRPGNRPEPKSQHLPGDLTKLQQQKRRGEGLGEKGWDRDTIEGARLE